jgi:hypothetical protein
MYTAKATVSALANKGNLALKGFLDWMGLL